MSLHDSTPQRPHIRRRLLPHLLPLIACLLALSACSDDDNEETPDYRALRYAVTSNASTSTTAQIALKTTVLSLYEQTVMEAIEDKLGEEPDFDDDTSEISIIVPYSTDTDICDNYINSNCKRMEDYVADSTAFAGNIIVTNKTNGSTIYSHVF